MSRPPARTVCRYQVTVRERVLEVELIESVDGLSVRLGDGEPRPAVVRRPAGDALASFLVGNASFSGLIAGRDGEYEVVVDGEPLHASVQDERAARLARATAAHRPAQADLSVRAPMPGLVVAIQVEPGQEVARGQSLVVLQAMKMENELIAREAGRVKEVLVSPGQTVDQDQTLVTLE